MTAEHLHLPEETQMLHLYCRIRDVAGEDVDCLSLQICENFEISVVTEGSGFHAIGENLIPCRENDLYILCPGVAHRYFSADPREQLTVRKLIFRLGDWMKGDIPPMTPWENIRAFFEANAAFAKR